MKHLLISSISALMLTACVSNDLSTTQIDSAVQKKLSESSITPAQAIKNARAAIAQAGIDELNFYTPLHYQDAQQHLEDVEALQKKQNIADKNTEILKLALKTETLIANAYQVKKTILSTLAESLSHKEVLLELGSKTEFPRDYQNLLEDLEDLFKLIENNKVEQARKKQVTLLADMVEVEVDTLIKQQVSPAEVILDKAEDNDADDYAEQTYEKAELAIERAKKFIASNYRQRAQVSVIANEALIAAKRALNIGAEAKLMVEMNEEAAEQKALEQEALIAMIIKGMQLEGLAGLTLREQVQKITEHGQFTKTKVTQLTERLSQLEQAQAVNIEKLSN